MVLQAQGDHGFDGALVDAQDFLGRFFIGGLPEWISNGTNTYISTNTRRGGHSRTLENEYTDLINIGKIFNVEDKAQAILRLDQNAAQLRNHVAAQLGRAIVADILAQELNDSHCSRN